MPSIILTTEQIVIDRIKIDKDRKFDETVVQQLMKSIPIVGLLQPVILQRPGTGLGVKLVFGCSRIEACHRLKQRAITARVVNGDTPEIRLWIEQAAIDENLIRRIYSLPPEVISADAWRRGRTLAASAC